MPTLRILTAALALLLTGAALAQTPATVSLRGTIDAIAADGSISAKARNGEPATVRLKPGTGILLVVPATLADVKAGAFIGVAALPAADGALKAMEVHIFPEAMRGTGEGHRPFDLGPTSSMTNGALATRVEGVEGPTLTVNYKGGTKTIHVEPTTPIVTFEPGALSDLKPGAAFIARGARADDGAFEAARFLVGKDGLTPPM